MSDKSYESQSRVAWVPVPPDRLPNTTELALGCLQRIADAVEAMGVEHRRMRSAQIEADRLRADNLRLTRAVAALRGIVRSARKPKRRRGAK